jgi:hypothetical protein
VIEFTLSIDLGSGVGKVRWDENRMASESTMRSRFVQLRASAHGWPTGDADFSISSRSRKKLQTIE